ncbi:ABC-type dipeptide/oligopeptide/nickel transport system, ATPase component [Pseudomonas syringae]|uniref:AAA family ATPase n=1 Tax=Pseudomonas syringae TaxID=317 RepID=UPI0008E12D2B|nr:AAA family ATPase [Pseudomonas syringae]MDC3741954.1 AAA family ATPase [Pseudomonas syringae pv. syringae]SFH95525.1 ABC-type dipeptide/oligopeptide/nickel transport system, ATPase component [Pseudomonas syringae]
MTFTFQIPNSDQQTPIAIEPGSSVIFVGANGSGKTRLAVFIEDAAGSDAHRISAHRALSLNPAVPKIRGVEALRKLRLGWDHESATIFHRSGNRWADSKPAVAMLNDFDSLLQALFADQSVTTLDTHSKARSGTLTQAMLTKFETLSDIWQRLLPHRQLVISGDDIQVSVTGGSGTYPASDMSDGERAIFYLLAQALVAAESSLLIIDEPELHVHPSIMSSLWDEIEAARKDCAFIFITHDLHFAATRAAQKYVIKSYTSAPSWTIESVPDDTGFSEEVTTLILGSRRPILFVEGAGTSLDLAIYRCCYSEWTVIPRGSCEQVVHAVVTMRANAQLTRVTCAGIVDADDYTSDEIQYLNGLGVYPLLVSEVENLILLPEVSRVIAQTEGYTGADLEQHLSKLQTAIFNTLQSQAAIDDVVVRYCRRRIDRALKKVDLSGPKSIDELLSEYASQTAALDIAGIAAGATKKIQDALANGDLPSLLTIYDNKGMLALAAQHLKQTRLASFEGWLTRMLRDVAGASGLVAAFKGVLPSVQAS